MKRFLSIMMASVLMTLTLSTGLTAMAENITTSTGSQSFNVSFNVAEGDIETLTPVYDVDISITNDLRFIYTKKYKQQWNNTTHEIETVVDTEKSGWSNTEESVTVTNNSNVGVKVSIMGSLMPLYGVTASLSEVREKWLNPEESVSGKITIRGTPDDGKNDSQVGMVTIQIS